MGTSRGKVRKDAKENVTNFHSKNITLIDFSAKDQKNRELFEKIFPEIKREREEKERNDRHDRNSAADEQVKPVEEVAFQSNFK